ncbi:MAG: hypothetical protein IJ515_06315 [Clostridia bacterium]|nr:hypothetical protein [Clostridia bacterium]
MISSIIKLSVSDFVLRILQNDAERFGFLKKEKEPNLNGLLNKLIPNLLYFRKAKRDEIYRILNEDFARNDTETIYECVNTVIDRVYFSDVELQILDEVIWFRPSIKQNAVFDEIEQSETKITGQTTTEYIRGLLNEYSRFPQYKRETIAFDNELYDYAMACETSRIFHATVNGKSIRLFAFHYVYGFTYDQSNYLIGYDMTNKVIGAIPLCKIRDSYLVERKYKPSEKLIDLLQEYYENKEYDKVIPYEEEQG